MKRFELAVAVVSAVAGFSVSHAASGTWEGGPGNAWTTDANWSAAPYPQGDDVATFGAAGAGVVDVSGLSGIRSLVFSGAAFTLGSGGTGAQSLTWMNGGAWTLSGGAAAQTVAAHVLLGQDAAVAEFAVANNSAAALTFAGNVTGASGGSAGAKTLRFRGNGTVEIAGNLNRGGASALDLVTEGTGTLRLTGNNNVIRQLNMNGAAGGVLDIGAGSLRFDYGGNVNLRSQNSATVNGTGSITLSGGSGDDHSDSGAIRTDAVLTINPRLTGPAGFEYWVGSNDAAGTVVFNGTNDFMGSIAINSAGTISANIIGNNGSQVSNLGQGSKILFNGNGTGSCLRYTGTGETANRTMYLPKSARFEMAGTGRLVLTTPFVISGGANTIYLSGSTAGVGEIAGVIGNGSGAYSVNKSGTGTWVLSGANTFSGALTVSGGTLALVNANAAAGTANISNGGCLLIEGAGTALSVSAFALTGGSVLEIRNTAAANNANRVSASAAVSLQSSTLVITNDAGAADYSVSLGVVTAASGTSTIQTQPAAAGRSGTLRLAGLISGGGMVNFVGDGLGDSDRNRVFIVGMPDGIIGPWAFVNGTKLAAYDSVRGVYASSDESLTYTDIAAWGDTIPDGAAANIRIATHGSGAELALAANVTSVASLLHDTDTNAVAATAGKTLQTSAVRLASGAWPLTLGEAAGDGVLTALPNGALLTLDNDSASVLRVNAALADNGRPLQAAKLGTGPVRLSGPLNNTGGLLLIGNGLDVDIAADATLGSVVSGIGAWSKSGAGTLRLDGNNTFSGTFTVREGAVIPGHNNALGDPSGTVVIEDGATLDLSNGMAQNALTLNKTFVMRGFGQDRNGAVVNRGNTQYNTFGKVRLADDTGFGGPARWDFRSGTPTLSLDGYTLYKVDVNEISLVNTTVNPDRQDGTKGHIDIEKGVLTLESNATLNGGAGNSITVRSGATLHFWGHNNPSYWSLLMKHGAAIGGGSGGGGTQNAWRGPIEFEGDTWFNRSAGVVIDSGITGAGSLWHISGTTYLKGTNTYAGTTTVSNGTIHAWTPYTLPGWQSGRVTGVAGTMILHTGDGQNGWTKAQILAYKDATAMTASHWLNLDTTQLSFDMDQRIEGTFSFAKSGEGPMTLRDGIGITGSLSVVGAAGSVLTLAPATSNACIGVNVTGGTGTSTATLNVNGPLYMSKATVDQRVRVSNNDNGRSYMNINADIEAGAMLVGNGSNTFAAVTHNSGDVQSAPTVANAETLSVGAHNFGYGYYRMNGGTHRTGQLSVTGNNTGTGVLDIFGGEMSVTAGWLLTCWGGGNGIINLHGGTLGVYPPTGGGVNLTDAASRNAFSMVNLLGANATADFALRTSNAPGVNMAKSAGNALSAINLNAGTMVARRIYAASTATPTFLNFNGGTLRASADGILLDGSITAATLYDGGAVIDTSTNLVIVQQPLLAPTDCGVSAIALASPGASYIGPPVVKLTGGSGNGAMAIATVNADANSPAFGQLTGITVTAPGTGYQPGDTLTATLTSGGGTGAGIGAVTLAPHAQSGGLTKRGTGTLTLMAPCTYKGPTRVAEGTLRFTSHIAGLYEGSVANASGNINKTSPSPKTSTLLTTRMANTSANWPNSTTYVYSGFIWNNADTNVTWTFAKSFDDAILLTIDTTVVLDHDGWSVTTNANYTLTPGAHPFEARFGQGGGGVGPVTADASRPNCWWTRSDIGFGYDPLGRYSQNSADYLPMTDPGDGSLFTLTASTGPLDMISHSSGVIVDAGATLDLGGAPATVQNLSGNGAVINGTLNLTGDLMPGGNGAIGTLTLGTGLTSAATYHVDTAPGGASDLVIVNGNADLSQTALRVVDLQQLSRNRTHTILTATGTITGTFTTDNLPRMWSIRYLPDTVKIVPASGTIIILR